MPSWARCSRQETGRVNFPLILANLQVSLVENTRLALEYIVYFPFYLCPLDIQLVFVFVTHKKSVFLFNLTAPERQTLFRRRGAQPMASSPPPIGDIYGP